MNTLTKFLLLLFLVQEREVFIRDLEGIKTSILIKLITPLYEPLGATSIEKITKISASGRNFLDPLPPSSKKGPTDENVGISYLIVIIKFGFFRVSNPSPPYFIRKPNLTDFIN